jgi:hypothetical protein
MATRRMLILFQQVQRRRGGEVNFTANFLLCRFRSSREKAEESTGRQDGVGRKGRQEATHRIQWISAGEAKSESYFEINF